PQTLEAPVTQQLPYWATGAGGARPAAAAPIATAPVFLLDPRLIILAIRPRPREFNPVTEAIVNQPVVDELAAIIHVQAGQGEGQAEADTLECFNYEAAL